MALLPILLYSCGSDDSPDPDAVTSNQERLAETTWELEFIITNVGDTSTLISGATHTFSDSLYLTGYTGLTLEPHELIWENDCYRHKANNAVTYWIDCPIWIDEDHYRIEYLGQHYKRVQ